MITEQALSLYNLKQPQADFIHHNENMTYKITDAGKAYVLRVHKPVEGFSVDIFDTNHSKIERIQSELEIISGLRNNTTIPMQAPVAGTNGSLVQTLADSTPITLLEWVTGETVNNIEMTPDILKDSGKMIGEMHSFLSSAGKAYTRPAYDQSLLLRIAERIENAAYLEIIKPEQARIIEKALGEMRKRFDELDTMYERAYHPHRFNGG